MNPSEFEYLIRKTITYLDFHGDDSAKELAADWNKVLQQIKKMKSKKVKMQAKIEPEKLP